MEICKVEGCNNTVLEIKDESRHETMQGLYGYCQIHNIDGLVSEKTEKTLLIVKANPNMELGKPEYDWEFPDKCDTSRMIGILEMIKHDLLDGWAGVAEEHEGKD